MLPNSVIAESEITMSLAHDLTTFRVILIQSTSVQCIPYSPFQFYHRISVLVLQVVA